MSASQTVDTPLDFLRLYLNDMVIVQLRHSRTLTGRLHSYDDHCNLLLSHVSEAIEELEIIEETGEEIRKIKKRNMDILFVRGDTIILVAPAPADSQEKEKSNTNANTATLVK